MRALRAAVVLLAVAPAAARAQDLLGTCLGTLAPVCLAQLARDSAQAQPDPNDAMLGLAYLGYVQARGGDRAGATVSLDAAARAAESIKDAVERDFARTWVAPMYAAAGDMAAALALADAIGAARDRDDALAAIVGQAIERGDIAGAEGVVARARAGELAAARVALGGAYAARGEFERAAAVARGLTADQRGALLADLAKHMADANRTHEAIKLALELADGPELDAAMAALVASMAERLVLGDARVVAAALTAPGPRDTAFAALAAAEAGTGDFTGAVADAGRVVDQVGRLRAREAVAQARAQSGDVTGAVAFALTEDYAQYRAILLGAVAKVQAEAGNVANALVTVARIDVVLDRNRLIADLGKARLDAGDKAGARRCLELLTAGAPFADAAVVGFARLGEHERARDIAASLPDGIVRAWALLDAARAVKAPDAARTYLGLAVVELERDPNAYGRDDAARVLAVQWARAGDAAQAAALIAGLSASGRVMVFTDLLPQGR